MSKKKNKSTTIKQRMLASIEEWSKEDRIFYAYLALHRVCTDPVLFRKITQPHPEMVRDSGLSEYNKRKSGRKRK
jgi:hypothetical protein